MIPARNVSAMAEAALAVAIVSALAAIGAVLYARSTAASAKVSAKAAQESADAVLDQAMSQKRLMDIEDERRREEVALEAARVAAAKRADIQLELATTQSGRPRLTIWNYGRGTAQQVMVEPVEVVGPGAMPMRLGVTDAGTIRGGFFGQTSSFTTQLGCGRVVRFRVTWIDEVGPHVAHQDVVVADY